MSGYGSVYIILMIYHCVSRQEFFGRQSFCLSASGIHVLFSSLQTALQRWFGVAGRPIVEVHQFD